MFMALSTREEFINILAGFEDIHCSVLHGLASLLITVVIVTVAFLVSCCEAKITCSCLFVSSLFCEDVPLRRWPGTG